MTSQTSSRPVGRANISGGKPSAPDSVTAAPGGLLLAIDTSAVTGSLAIAELTNSEPKILSERRWDKLAMHSEVATLEVSAGLKVANLTLENITHFAINAGPGSFTGLRVGINLIRTLAYALDKPVAMFTSLEALAFANSRNGESVLIATKAIQNFYYAAVYKNLGGKMQTMVEPFSANLTEVEARGPCDKTLIEGSGTTYLRSDARTLVQLSVTASFSSWKTVKPLYVRASEAEEKLMKGILKPLP